MEALRTSAVQAVSSTRGGDAAMSLASSSTAVFGGPLRKQATSAGWGRKGREGSGDCRCVAATASATGTLYSVLGVESGGSLSEIKSAYKQMARRYHPDVCALDDRDTCTHKFLEVQHAYEVLSDPQKRAEYDYALMHPSFAQALGNRSSSSWGRSRRTQGSDGVSDAWRFQWEAQLSRLRRHSDLKNSPVSNSDSWGARMRQEMNEL